MALSSQGGRRLAAVGLWLTPLAALLVAGCGPAFSEKARFGITFYCPGAGNVDFGDAGIRQGLEAAGYQGQVATYLWTISFNPAIDQSLRLNAKLRARQLANIVESYIDQFPDRPVHMIGLSGGTGVVMWALENLERGYAVDNVVLLGSSLYYRYDIAKALPHVRGQIYNYYSSNDAVLAVPMKVFGTIDGVFGEDGAGSVGLRPPRGAERVVNIAWKSEFQRYGYSGGHTDATSPRFVQAFIARHITGPPTAARLDTGRATGPAPVLLAGARD